MQKWLSYGFARCSETCSYDHRTNYRCRYSLVQFGYSLVHFGTVWYSFAIFAKITHFNARFKPFVVGVSKFPLDKMGASAEFTQRSTRHIFIFSLPPRKKFMKTPTKLYHQFETVPNCTKLYREKISRKIDFTYLGNVMICHRKLDSITRGGRTAPQSFSGWASFFDGFRPLKMTGN